jgi:hypothetical protein
VPLVFGARQPPDDTEHHHLYVPHLSPTPPTNIVFLIGGAEAVDDVSVDEAEYDIVSEEDQDRVMRLGKSVIYLSDLARKDPRVHKYKSYLYLYNVLTVALFYGLPVIQLVVTYQRVLNETGEQDLCYYNFLCAHPVGVISDFNHVFSNSGYVLLGVLFLWITYRREITHKDLNFERQYGIPQHYGMFYAMGVALIMEGVLSGSYHVCPNQANFQFGEFLHRSRRLLRTVSFRLQLHVRHGRLVHGETLPESPPGHKRDRLRHVRSPRRGDSVGDDRNPRGESLLLDFLHRDLSALLFLSQRADLLHGLLEIE